MTASTAFENQHATPRGWEEISHVKGRLRARHRLIGVCADFEGRLRAEVTRTDGVQGMKISVPTSKVLIRYDPERLTAVDVWRILGHVSERFVADVSADPPAAGVTGQPATIDPIVLSSVAVLASGASKILPVLHPVAVPLAIAASIPTFVRAASALLVDRRVKVDILDAVALGLLHTQRRHGAAVLLVWALDLGTTMVGSAKNLSEHALSSIFGTPSQTATSLQGGEEVTVSVDSLVHGDVVVIRTGEIVPADGTIIDGAAIVDQHVLTGESAPVERETGHELLASTVVLAGEITIRVSEAGSDTAAAQIVRILEESASHRGRLETQGERFADAMVVPTLGLGGVGRYVRGPAGMIAIINADFGTGIRVAAPLAMLSSVSVAARHGIVVKHAGVLETLTTVETAVFDKTGTLTEVTPVVERIVSYDSAFSESDVLSSAVAAQGRISHPIARALLREAEHRGLGVVDVDQAAYTVGLGIEVTADGVRVNVGSARYLEREGIDVSAAGDDLQRLHRRGGSSVLVAVEQRIVGLVGLAASARPDAFEMIDALRHRSRVERIYLLSGDNEGATRFLARQLGIEHYFGEVSPQGKADIVRSLQEEFGSVVMVGDGINDAPSMAQADCSISFSGAADVATDIADVVIMDGGLAQVITLFDLSERLRRNVKRSMILTVVPNTLLIGGVFTGTFGIASSLLLNNGMNLLSAANGVSIVVESPAERPPITPALLSTTATR